MKEEIKNKKTTEYRILISKLVIFVVLFGLLLIFVFPEYESSYASSLIDKVNRLESIKEPKIVLIGNSNLVYGIDSKLLEEVTGMPVVNMGFHGGMGNDFHERMMSLNVTEGDIYIVCHTTFWDEGGLADPVLTWVCVEEHPELWKLIYKKDYKDMYEAFSTYFKHAIVHHTNCEDMTDMTRYDFNAYGDMGTYREYDGYDIDFDWYPMAVGDNNTERLNEWNRYLSDRGATLLVAAYPIMDCEHTANEELFMDAEDSLIAGLDCQYISDYKDYMYPKEYFYGSALHLTSEGAQIRTEQLIEDLKSWNPDRF